VKIVSGIPGGQIIADPASVEFAIAPVENDKPSYSRSIFIKSDDKGKFRVSLPPGKYWLGPRGKASDPTNYTPSSISVPEQIVTVTQGSFTKVDIYQTGYAP
jgi:hypothetical protein